MIKISQSFEGAGGGRNTVPTSSPRSTRTTARGWCPSSNCARTRCAVAKHAASTGGEALTRHPCAAGELAALLVAQSRGSALAPLLPWRSSDVVASAGSRAGELGARHVAGQPCRRAAAGGGLRVQTVFREEKQVGAKLGRELRQTSLSTSLVCLREHRFLPAVASFSLTTGTPSCNSSAVVSQTCAIISSSSMSLSV